MSDFIKYRTTIKHSTGANDVVRTFNSTTERDVDYIKESDWLIENGWTRLDPSDRDEGVVFGHSDNRTVTFVFDKVDVGPVVGLDATENYVTDRNPVRVIEVNKSRKTIKVARLSWKVVEGSEHDGSAKYEYGDPVEGSSATYTWRSAVGRYVAKGQTARHGVSLTLGSARRYYDPHL